MWYVDFQNIDYHHINDVPNDFSGPYDELMLVPGAFDVPGKNKKRLRMTRIYVSQKDTMYNGTYC
jgi:hypothetical protein